MPLLTDHAAKEIACRRFGLPECLHVAIAAIDQRAIENYVGEIVQTVTHRSPLKAFVVRVAPPPAIDWRLPIWQLPSSGVLHRQLQLWVHIRSTRYRAAYKKAFPAEDIKNKVMSHAMNRRVAALKGFSYVRIDPVSRAVNSSSGFSENWAVALHKAENELRHHQARGAFIQYADLSDIMVMLDMKAGGGVMELVNLAQKLVKLDYENAPTPKL